MKRICGYILLIALACHLISTAQVLPEFLPQPADWGSMHYLTNPEYHGNIYDARISVTDSILHIYTANGDREHIYHFISSDNGDDWILLADEYNPDYWINFGPVMSYFGHDKFYTIYQAVEEEPWWTGFTYFRASTDYGVTWAWSSQLRMPIEGAARACNITGNGDTLFIVAYQGDSLHLWRSYDAGHNWLHLNTPCNGGYHTSGLEYDKSKQVLHVAFLTNDWDISYVRSTAQGDTWDEVIPIGFPEDGPSNLPAMESDGLGNVIITWQDWHERPGEPPRIYCRVSHTEGATWEPAIPIGENAGSWSDVTISGSYAGMAWCDKSLPGYRLAYIESFDGGDNWEQPYMIATGNFVYGSIIRINETIHVTVRRDVTSVGSMAAYVRYDPYTGIEDDIPENPSSAILMTCYPNPFNSLTVISLTGNVDEIMIFNLEGRLIKRFSIAESQIQVVWDARDADGQGVASGIYFVRAYSENISTEVKLIYLK